MADIAQRMLRNALDAFVRRDIELARQISGFARELGVRADVAGRAMRRFFALIAPVAMGAWRLLPDGRAELKRMFVRREWRGRHRARGPRLRRGGR